MADSRERVAAGMGRQKMLATMQMLRTDENLNGAILVALGSLFILLSFTFYPVYLVPLLAIACGAVAYRNPPIGTILSMVLAFPAVAYQAPVLAWLFSLAVALALFEAFEHWGTISFLQIAILAPFAPFPFSLLSGFIFLALALAAFAAGSKHSIFISIPAIIVVLLLSTLWLMPTSSFITVSSNIESAYGPPMDVLQNNALPEVGIVDLVPVAGESLAGLFSVENIYLVSPAIGKITTNVIKLVIQDSAFVQIIVWAIALFICAALPARFDHRYKQTISSFSLFLVPITMFLVAPSFNNPFDIFSFVYCAISVGIIFAIERLGIKMTREQLVQRKEKQKAFGKFGIEALPDSGVERLEDIGGYGDVKGELREAIMVPLKKPEYAYTYGLKPPKGILLFGPPGTGKTMLMRALANELNIGFEYVKCSNLLSEWYGETEKNLAEVFSIARKNAPYLLFFDEIDAIGKSRDSYSSDDVAPRVLSVFLQEMDGFRPNPKKPVIVVGATNVPDQLDAALMRPGRFDKIVYMHLPDEEARVAIFKVHLKSLHDRQALADDIDYAKLAQITKRFSGADIKNICTESSRLAAKEAMKSNSVVKISMAHLVSITKRLKPSVTLDKLEEYEKFRMDYERRSEAEEKAPDEAGIRWDQVAGLDNVRQVLLESIELPLLHEDLMKELDVKPSKGLLLFGPPGCGKTLIVRAAANELKANFMTISGAELMRSKSKDPSAYVKEVFNRARESPPAIVFIDEIEALAPNRAEFRGGILSDLLQELDGVRELKNVMLIGTTNKPSFLDPAILRPGRFDKILYIPPPGASARERVFMINLTKFSKDVDFKELAEVTPGFSGADIASVCQEAKMQLIRTKLKKEAFVLNTEVVMKIISKRRPSITKKELEEYAAFMHEYGERK